MSAFRTALLARNAVPRALPRTTPIHPRSLRRTFATQPDAPIPLPPSPAAQKASKTPYFLAGIGLSAIVSFAYLFGPGEFSGAGKTGGDTLTKADNAVKGAEAVVEAKLGLKRGIEEYQKVYNKIAESLDAEDYDDGSYGPVLVRLAWHSSGTYDKESNTGGSNYATMRFEPESKHGANNGLDIARNHMEKIKKDFPWISYGDLWTLGGVAAVQELGGPVIPWRPGRIDGHETHVTPDGRLPDASQAHDHLRQIFYRMGFNDQEIVALSGAHALGRCHDDRSGFTGPWQFSPTSFNNEYFKLLLNEKWGWKKWSGPKQYEDVKTKSLMMLPTDMSLVKDKKFLPHAKAYADDEDLFFKDFAAVFHKLLELGVPTAQFASEPWTMKTTADQEA